MENIYRIGNHKRTPRAIKSIRRHARKMFNVGVVKLDTSLNKIVWNKGIKRPPHKIRVKYTLKKMKGGGGKSCVQVTHVPVTSFKKLKTKRVAA